MIASRVPLALLWLVALAAPTLGEGRQATVDPPAAAPAAIWSGFYFGGNLGWAWGTSDWRTATTGDATLDTGTIDLYNGYNPSAGTGSYSFGLQAGHDLLLANGVVIGTQIDTVFPNFVGGSAHSMSSAAGLARLDLRQEWAGTVRGRLGLVRSGILIYGTGGWAWSWDRIERTQATPSGLPGGSAQGDLTRARVFHGGWVAGAGVELPVGGGWTLGFEYLLADLGRETVRFEGGAQRVSSDLHEHSARATLNYHVAADAARTADGPEPMPASVLDRSRWALHGQTTYLHQFAVPFREPYRGTNSLIPRQSRETWDATAYVGYRPWRGGEIWFNPEIVQGFGLANTLGAAGFPSGEAYKIGSAYPYARVPRLFLRQTIDLGGASEEVEAGINQFADKRTTDRLVLTVGKFSASDIFDDNKFAHDPRTDFMNWALIDTGTWDYAADAWGYTYAAAAEYVRGNWTFSAGVFDLPRFPNSTELDTTFKQYQVIGEIERRHVLWGQPGELNITGFLSHARMGRFDEATRIARLLSSPADIAGVRRFNNRTGVAASIEQNITADIGAFVRAGWSDGRLEPFAFTDIDRTVAAGLSIGGSAWNRPRDTLGVAGVVNDISGVHKRFLDAGGLGILVGDGRLPRPGTERILETYYALPLFGWRFTLDYQLIVNPAYNSERGPVSVIGTRLRSQF